jgi:hypothetical protein
MNKTETNKTTMSNAQSKMMTVEEAKPKKREGRTKPQTLKVSFRCDAYLRFDEWVPFAHTDGYEFSDETLYREALQREWAMLLDETSGVIEADVGWEDELLEEALQDYSYCSHQERLQSAARAQAAAAAAAAEAEGSC